MTDPIETLRMEHRVIERVLVAFESFASGLEGAGSTDRATLREYIHFFRDYIDRNHHGKEENLLFEKVRSCGFAEVLGPVEALVSEQDEARAHINAMTLISEGTGSLSDREQALVRGYALAYVIRISLHLKNEEDVLFPLLERVLPNTAMGELASEFEVFDRVRMGHHEMVRLHALARGLSRSPQIRHNRGIVTMNREPLPTSVSTSIVPP